MPTDIAVRASDADRNVVAGQLADHLVAGRLDLVEYDERVAAAYASATVEDLRPLSGCAAAFSLASKGAFVAALTG